MIPLIVLEELLTVRNLITAYRVNKAIKLIDGESEDEDGDDEVIRPYEEVYFYLLSRSIGHDVDTKCKQHFKSKPPKWGSLTTTDWDDICEDALDSDTFNNAPSDAMSKANAFIDAFVHTISYRPEELTEGMRITRDWYANPSNGFTGSIIPAYLATIAADYKSVAEQLATRIAEEADPQAVQMITDILAELAPSLKEGRVSKALAANVGVASVGTSIIGKIYQAFAVRTSLNETLALAHGQRKGTFAMKTGFLSDPVPNFRADRPTYKLVAVTRQDIDDVGDEIYSKRTGKVKLRGKGDLTGKSSEIVSKESEETSKALSDVGKIKHGKKKGKKYYKPKTSGNKVGGSDKNMAALQKVAEEISKKAR